MKKCQNCQDTLARLLCNNSMFDWGQCFLFLVISLYPIALKNSHATLLHFCFIIPFAISITLYILCLVLDVLPTFHFVSCLDTIILGLFSLLFVPSSPHIVTRIRSCVGNIFVAILTSSQVGSYAFDFEAV
ncbi:hypothetical protein Dimus_001936 [Dionaea muscipula]